jgi:hypothetical protein
VLSHSVKALGWACVVIMNVFFVYFSILRAYERGYAWQRMFALACLVQFLVEVIVYETTECAMVHFLIPDLVRTEVQTAGVALRSVVNQLCTSRTLGPSSSSSLSSSKVVLDAPRYLFVSTVVAERYPDMLESVLIRSYHTFWPGSYATQWRFDHFSVLSGGGGVSPGFLRSMSVTVILISLLKEFGASSPVIQRLLLHSLQPLLVAAILYVGSIFLLHPLYWLTLVPVVAYGVHHYRKYRWEVSQDDQGKDNDGTEIHPLEETTQPSVTIPSHPPEIVAPVVLAPIPVPVSAPDPSLSHDVSSKEQSDSEKSSSSGSDSDLEQFQWEDSTSDNASSRRDRFSSEDFFSRLRASSLSSSYDCTGDAVFSSLLDSTEEDQM